MLMCCLKKSLLLRLSQGIPMLFSIAFLNLNFGIFFLNTKITKSNSNHNILSKCSKFFNEM